MRKRFGLWNATVSRTVCKQSKQHPSAFVNKTKWRTIFECLDSQISTWISWLLPCYRNQWKCENKSVINISVSFNKRISNVFYCKHLDGSLENIESWCLLCPPYCLSARALHREVNVSKQTKQNVLAFEVYETQGQYIFLLRVKNWTGIRIFIKIRQNLRNNGFNRFYWSHIGIFKKKLYIYSYSGLKTEQEYLFSWK